MHGLFAKVLTERSLSKAGELFSLEDDFILPDIAEILDAVRSFISESDFLENPKEQSIIEIVVSRISNAIRKMESSSPKVGEALVHVLSTCLSYNLRPPSSIYAKVAADLMASVFLLPSSNSLIQSVLPVSVKFLHKGNKDLSRNISSYLSLAAMKHADLLAQHLQPIIDSVISGNYSLARVLPQIYAVNKEPFRHHAMTLVSIMPNCETNEKISLITLFAQIAKDSPAVLESSVPQLCDGLTCSSTATATLQVFHSMSALHSASQPLSDHMTQFKVTADNFPKTIPLAIQLMVSIAKFKPESAASTLDYAVSAIGRLEAEKHSVVLKEIVSLALKYPSLLSVDIVNKLSSLESRSSSPSTKAYIAELRHELRCKSSGTVTLVINDSTAEAKSRFTPSVGESRSTSKLPTSYRSMTKLNVSTGIDARSGLHKSMTRLNTPQQNVVGRGVHTARSVTCITKQPKGCGPQGTSSPTKSMSSGSMPGADPNVLTVNVNRINQDLIRQVSNVLSSKELNLSSKVTEPASSYTHLAPFSLPTSSRRHYHSSGPIPTPSSQPPLLGLPSTQGCSVPATPIRPTSTGLFSNTLPNQRRRSAHTFEPSDQDTKKDNDTKHNRISVFEPYPMRDTVQHFCEKHLGKIKSYMESLMVKLPLPIKCTIEERKGKKHAKLHFACQGRTGEHCLYKNTFYTMRTRNPRIWIHLMFLSLQSRSSSAISTREISVSALKNCWEILKCEALSFVALVTGAFPPSKDQDSLQHELRSHRFFDVFEYNGPRQHWGCFLCNHPDRASYFIQEQEPVIEGQLKEKKGGKWKIFKKWKSRYFTLSGAKLSYKESPNGENGTTQSLDVGSIRSVKVSKEGRRNIPKAFEIFTNDRTFILKAKDGSNAQQWVQCLSVAKARSQALDTNLRKLAYGGSLGRLNPHGRQNLFHPSSINSNITLRTAV